MRISPEVISDGKSRIQWITTVIAIKVLKDDIEECKLVSFVFLSFIGESWKAICSLNMRWT